MLPDLGQGAHEQFPQVGTGAYVPAASAPVMHAGRTPAGTGARCACQRGDLPTRYAPGGSGHFLCTFFLRPLQLLCGTS